jgi:hypothetical protein
MKTEKLFELLTLVNGVWNSQWGMVLKLVEAIKVESVDIKHKQYADKIRRDNPEWYPLDLSEVDTWSTFNTCIELRFINDITPWNGHPNNQLACEVKIYDGDSYYGYRKNLRFEALLHLPTAFIHDIERDIEYQFNKYLSNCYIDYLEAQKQLWIHNTRIEI